MKAIGVRTGFLLTFLICLVATSSLFAKKLGARFIVYAPVQQAMKADLVVIGTVTALEPELFETSVGAEGTKVCYLIAVVKIKERLFGPKGLTHVRVGVALSGQNDANYYNQGIANGMVYRGGITSASLTVGKEACFLLVKHDKHDFYSPPPNSSLLELSNPAYEEEVRRVKKAVAVLQKPIESLKAKESEDRQFAACILLSRYRTAPQIQTLSDGKQPSPLKSEPISEEESKLILAGLGELTWGDMGIDGQGFLSLQTLFWQLGLAEKDGWHQPVAKENEDYNKMMDEAVKKWIKDHGSKYRIQRYVLEHSNSLQ